MKTFSYSALDETESYVRGSLQARSLKKAMRAIEEQGLLAINLHQERSVRWARYWKMFERISRMDLIFFTRHLSTMLEAGVGIDQALKIAADQETSQKFREVIFDLHGRVQKGQTLHSALAAHPNIFPDLYVNMVKLGEQTGKLDLVLSYLLEQQERDLELITKARGAMTYPTIILIALFGITIFMIVFVVPRVTAALIEYDVKLPLATRIIIGLSDFMIHFGPLLIPAVAVLGYLFHRWTKSSKGKWHWDAFLLKIPRLNTIIREFNLARITRSMSTLLSSGVAVDKALELAAGSAGNSHYQKVVRSGIQFVQKGIPISEVLKGRQELFPPLCSRMIDVGEKTGKLDHMFSRLARFYEKSVLNSLNNITSVIEPVLLLTIGLAIGFMAVAVLTPIWKYSETI